MAGRARVDIRRGRQAEVVDDMALAKHLPCFGIFEFPSPVLGLMNLTCGIRVATQTGPRHLGTAFEFCLQLLELTMIRGRLPELLIFFRKKWRGCKQHQGQHRPKGYQTN